MIIRKQTLRLLLFDCLAVLLLLCGDCAAARRRQRGDDIAFAFTANVYNVTLEENARGTQFAISEGSIRMGVPLPDPDSTVRFKVVEHHSDKRKNDLFKAHAKQVGDFVFLRIRQKDKHDTPLNRELKDSYEFHVKATCKRKYAANLETTTLVKLRITDQNDAGPMFTLEADKYEATISDKIPPFSDVLQLEASDADIGINGQIYYSLVNRSSEFFVDPVTGWIRTLKPIRAGVYDLRARVEDRTSRIFYEDEEQKMPEWASDVQITVTESKKVHPKLLVETNPIDSFLTSTEQLAALITIENDDSHKMRVGLLDDDFRHWFHLNQSEDESKWQLYTVPGRIIPDGTNVTVSAGSEMGASGNVTANIKISLLSRHGLSFSQSKLYFSVDESAPLGFVIGNVAAKSLNPNATKLIRYNIESLDPNTTRTFRLHEEFGTLRVARQLDYENTKLYSFNVIAKLTGFGEQSSILVEVHLTDANNNSPIIPAKWARQGPIAILPGTKVGASLLKISAHDRDAGVNGKVGYKLSSEKETPFNLDFATGDISLSKDLPAKENDWKLTVWAVDGGLPFPRTASLNLVFYRNGTKIPSKPKPVLSSEPGNLHSPAFSPVSKITVREDAEIGKIIGSVSASDSDLGYNGFIRYSTWDEYFSLNLTSGEISVARDLTSLVRAGQESTRYELEVIASDRGDPPKTSQQKFIVEIQDVNNNAPEFDQPWYRIRLSEDTSIGTVVLQVNADDEDAGESGRIAYKLPVSDDDHFSIDEATGKLTLQRSLDRETNDVITYTIVAHDHGSPQQMSFVNFTVEVTDVNDNAPYCIEQLTKIRIPEDYPDGALVGCIAARDDDTGANGRLRYSIETPVTKLEGHSPFRIDHHTGCVFIHSPHRPLDYQIKNTYNLTIDVSDNGESMLSTTCNMVIELIDIDENLHAPEFDDVAHEASVNENMPIGTEVFTVLASDADDKNAKLQYSIVGGDGQGYFGIDSKGVIRTLSILDREKRWKYWLAVQATDDAPRFKSAILHLFVRVLDKNDHRPMTQLPIYFASVKENSPQNTVVVKLDATDGDDLDDEQQQLKFRIKKGDPQSFFRIDQNTGYITTSGSRKLDREAQREHELWISVCDSGEPQLCTDVPVIVTIQDVNDNVPVFTQPIHHYNVPAGVKGGKIAYKLPVSDDDHFSIDEATGKLTLQRSLDRETNDVITYTIVAHDHGSPQQMSFVNFTVEVTDVNDNAPYCIEQLTKIRIPEDYPDGALVGCIAARDDDTGANGRLRYSIETPVTKLEGHSPFRIDHHTGCVFIHSPHRPLDYQIKNTYNLTIDVSDNGESMLSTTCNMVIELIDIDENLHAPEFDDVAHEASVNEVIASDRGDPPKTSQQKFIVEIQDVNNNAPEFDQPWYRIRLSEDTSIGTVVLQVNADDEDAGESGRIAYKLPVSDDDHFSIDEATGKLTLQRSLDRETNDVITYTIVAHDHGSPQQMSFVNFTVEVTDVNDNAPYCIEQLTKIRIPEDYPDGALVGCIAARDDDTGANGRLRYSIETPVTKLEGHSPFRIDHHTGCVFIHSPHRPLDYQIKNTYNLTIDVSDNGESMLSTTCNMVIELIDIDENLHAPEFDDVAHEASVNENMPIGTEVFTVLASDADDKNAKLQYSIVGGDGQGYFGIDSKGVIRTLSILDREKRWKYWLAVQATDDAPRFKSAILHLFVRVLDKNDHRPMTQLPIYFASVKENSPQNTVVVKLDATDGDDLDDEQQQLKFRIKKGDPQSFFRIDQNTGYITTSGSRKLDREAQREHELWISVCDSGEPQLCTDVPVIVTIQDVNDNVPVFTQPIHHYNVPAGVKGVLARVFAVDADAGINAELYYNITDGDARFTIDEHGTISTVEAIGGDQVYPLTIQVTDRGLPAQLAQTRVVLTGTSRAKKTTENRAPKIKDSALVSPIHISDADQVGLTVAMLEASDKDGDSLWWSVKNGNVNQTFTIRPESGALMLAKPIEYLPSGTKRLNLTLTVSDGELEDEKEIVIQLARSPTSRPTFTAQHYRTQISEKTAIGTQIYNVKAAGEDVGPTTKPVLYTIFNVEDTALEDKLRIEPGTGNVLVMESLDFEAGKEIRAIVQARQGQLRNFATLTVGLTDDNDNSPQFSRKEEEVKVDASSQVGSVVTTLMAHDVDSGDNGKIKYTIVSGNELGLFSLNSATGVISVAKSLNEVYGESILTVKATDSGKYPLSDTSTIRIIPISNDTGVFRFSRVVYHRSIRESTPIGSIILVVSTEPNGQAKYEVQQPCPYFDVHPLSGAVFLSKWLTRERAKSVECTVLAKTRSGNIQDTAKIIIRPTNTNQHRPVFKQQIYRGFIRENAPSGSSVLLSDNSPLVVFAVDMDAGPNALVGYRILTPNEPYFVVDYVSGAVRTRKPLDYEKIKEWSFYVQARDMGLPVKSSPVPALVIVTVLDENDQAPVFSETEYNAKLILPTVTGLPVVKVTAEDGDTVGQLRYYIKNKTLSPLFIVNSTDGTLSTATGNSTAFKETNYKIQLFVTDGSQTTSTTVNVQIVKSSSSNGFRCAQLEYTTSLMENTTFTEGQHLLAVTAIGQSDGIPVVYRMLTERDEFILNTGTGVVSLTGIQLDREVYKEVKLLIEAKSIEPTPQIAQCVVKVKVSDLNDNAPHFVSLPYSTVVQMDAKIGEKVISVKAMDRDTGSNAMVQYSSSDIPKEFKLNKRDGKISVAAKLEDGKVYRFSVDATDQGQPPLKSSAPVVIRVIEKSRPLFTDLFYSVSVSETAPVGTNVATVKAVSIVNGFVVYFIEEGNIGGVFEIDWESGVISLRRPVDYEETPSLNLTIMAADALRDGMNSTVSVVIKIDGVNDNGPVFSQRIYSTKVTESTAIGTELIRVTAVDPDSADETVTYSVSGADSSVIQIDSETGIVKLKESLDFEKKSRYDISIHATDPSQFAGNAKLDLQVLDVNDEAPVFLTPFAAAELSDTAEPGQFIAILSVTDEDTVSSLSEDHQLMYSVIEGDETLFIVDTYTGEVLLSRRIEDEDLEEPVKLLNVSVTDGIFTAYGQLTVTLTSSGSRKPAPKFEQSQYVIGVRENNAVENRSALLIVHARHGVSPFHYSLGGGKEYRLWPIKIDKTTGKIHQKKTLEYKNTSRYVIPLVAEDAIGRRAFSTLTLNVIDENDSEPKFVVSKYSCSISSSAKEGESLLMVLASDSDSNDVIEYSMQTKGEMADLFKIHQKQGTITIKGKMDKHAGSSLSFTVKTTDSGNPPHHATAEVIVNVVSPETAIPKFGNSHYLFSIAEDASVGTVIGKLQQIEQAVEAVRFSITDPVDGLPFMIEKSSGRILVRGMLDRETQSEWRFSVRADAPGGTHSMTTATVRITDIDDNAPVFHGSYSKQSIPEDAPYGTSIAVFSATDADLADHVSFSIVESDGSEVVLMDSESGWLTVNGDLDRESRPFYDLTARATDDSGNAAEVPFRLEITDVNDEAPKFDEKSYSIRLNPAEVKIGQTVARVTVTDKDLPPFNTTRLFISRGNEDGIFRIADDGRITVARLGFPTGKMFFNLTLLAFDGKHSTTVPMKINIISPHVVTCSSTQLNYTIPESAALNTILRKADETESSLKYQLISSEIIPFVVDKKTGKITVAGALDAEVMNKYSFTLHSTSTNSECWQSVVVTVEDENDNSPVFGQKEYTVTIKENQPANPTERGFIIRVEATDKDSGDFGRIRFTLADGHGIFVIDERNGIISSIRPLDREEKDAYTLHVLASDYDTKNPKTAKSIVRVTVADQNDNAPTFERKEYNLQVMESESIGYQLLHLIADGGDSGETVTYRLVNGTHNHFVKLDEKTGILTLSEGLDFEKEKQLSLIVEAIDSGTPPLSGKTTVTIQVMDENDNAPVFGKNSYKAEVKENSANGTKVIKIEAKDADSEHYGRVEYLLTMESKPFAIQKDGWVTVAGEIDRETTESYRLTVEARDGGNLTAQVTVTIEVTDENDHAPQFKACNMTAVVQESVQPGHKLLTMVITDEDGPQNAGPFKIQLKGEGHRAFTVDDQLTIRTAAKLDHGKKDKFLLTVVATDKGGQSTDCPLTVFVKEESRHPPKITPLRVTLNTLKGEFRGGVIGRVRASDQDSGDMLRFALVEGSLQGPLPIGSIEQRIMHPTRGEMIRQPHTFRITAETGEVWAEHSIPSGIHAFNVTVTDGKYNTVSYVQIEVSSFESEAIEHAVAIHILDISVKEFFSKHSTEFIRLFSKHLNIPTNNINLLSVQDRETSGSRSTPSGVDILFSATRDGKNRGMLKPDHIYSRLKQEFAEITATSKLKYQLLTEVCTVGVCRRGECRERIELSDQQMTIVSVEGTAFVAPKHSRYAECICPEGLGGSRCDLELNGCSRSPCKEFEMCAADDDSIMGYECICPPGTEGEKCAQPACETEGQCAEKAEISVSGTGFFEMSLANDVETRMELDVDFRTVTSDGTLMYAAGATDYHSLDIVSGHLEYRWNAGAGEGVVRTKGQLTDGQWHHIRISRRGRRTRITLDKETNEAYSPAGAEVLNLGTSGLQLTFGAKVVKTNGSSIANISKGVAACFSTIMLDGRSLPKTRQGLRLQSATTGCSAMTLTPCSEAPCKNGATCHAIGKTYSCLCPPRYEGDHCEIDRDPCADSPCPLGVQCIPYFNEYLCKCPDGFTGKRCQDRKFGQMEMDDVCSSNPCGATGECIVIPKLSIESAGFICNCTHGLSSTPCDQKPTTVFSQIGSTELLYSGIALLVILLIVIIIILYCKCMQNRSSDPKYGEHVHNTTHLRNPHVNSTLNSAPPPLPPRNFRGNALSNLEQAQMTGLPTVQVRPYPVHERMSSSGRGDSRSPSLSGSGKQWKNSHDYGSAADGLNRSGRQSQHDLRALEALRRFGVKLSDDDSSSVASGPSNRAGKQDRRQKRARDALESLNQDRYPLGDSIQCLPTAGDRDDSRWTYDGVDRIAKAVRTEQLRLEGITNRVLVGDTVLSPLVNDDDYMTMRPRKTVDSTESQRRPLLANEDLSDELPDSSPPPPPLHKRRTGQDAVPLYDDPIYDKRKPIQEAPSEPRISEIDGPSDTEV